MKKYISILLALAILFSFAACGNSGSSAPATQETATPVDAAPAEPSPAEEAPAAPAPEASSSAYVTILIGGSVATSTDGTLMAKVPVAVADTNSNSIIDVDDVLAAAHAAYCPGGYASEEGDYGLSLTKLWNDESFAFGFYIDNTMAMSLTDEVLEGSTVTAYVFSDKESFSDLYCYFDSVSVNGSEATVVLYAITFDENWSPVYGAYEGATLAIVQPDGSLVAIDDVLTDANGSATFEAEAGQVISVIGSEAEILVPAVAVIG